MPRDVVDEIKREIAENKIVLYMKGTPEEPRCGFSAAAADVLRQIGAPFKAVNVLEDREKWQAIREYSNWPTIPQLYVDGQFIGGCDIMREMFFKGELQPLIQKALGGTPQEP
ncbi:MAG: Grx4 family monothiol glutaredoxin [Acidobacteria bacterium]|nr:MAG: Grx4 family monothiol glutaredoxin [Acidobacteriota bacterium]